MSHVASPIVILPLSSSCLNAPPLSYVKFYVKLVITVTNEKRLILSPGRNIAFIIILDLIVN
jgi:hypothetical protein